MIGKKVLFFRAEWMADGNGIKKWHAFTGIVLDKIQTHEVINGKPMACNQYIVQLPGGHIESFRPDEAAEVIRPNGPLPDVHTPNQVFIQKQLRLAR